MSRNGTPMQRLRDRGRISLPPEKRVAYVERRLEMQAEGAVETVLGNRPFSVVNVDGTDVAPFLGKTDGSALTDASGLGASVVETAAIDTTAIRPAPPATNASAVSVDGLSAYGGNVNAAGASTVVSTSFTLTATEEVTIAFQASGDFSNAETTEVGLFVNYAGVHSMQAIRDLEGPYPAQYRELRMPDASGGGASVVITAVRTLAAGTHTILVLAMGENPAEFVIPAGASAVEVYVR